MGRKIIKNGGRGSSKSITLRSYQNAVMERIANMTEYDKMKVLSGVSGPYNVMNHTKDTQC